VETVQVWVSGVVQGVGFRWHVLRHAQHLGIRGWVRNLADERVEMLAQGPAEQLQRLLEKVRQGPPHSRVRDLEQVWHSGHPELGPFSIR